MVQPQEDAENTTSRRERKRASDRESQRLSRARSKAYIAQLEQTIAELSRNPDRDQPDALLQRLKDQNAEIEQLKSTLRSVSNIIQRSDVTHGESLRLMSDSTSSDGVAEASSESLVIHRRNTRVSTSQEHPTGRSAFVDSLVNEPSLSLPPSFPELQADEELGDPSLACSDGDRNYFAVLSEALSKVQLTDNRTPFSGAKVDDDICIRAVLHGWNATVQKHELDDGWKVLRDLDRGLMPNVGPIERMASMRLLRSVLMRRISPVSEPPRAIPPYMEPTQLQLAVAHSPLIDYFAWPDVRNLMIVAGLDNVPESVCARFFSQSRFQWQYDLRDIFKRHVPTGLYAFSGEFEAAYSDLNSWPKPQELQLAEALSMEIQNMPTDPEWLIANNMTPIT